MGSGLAKWVDDLQASGKYAFLRDQAIKDSGLSHHAVAKALQRLAQRQRIVKVKEYFFIIVPVEYVHAGAPPPSWYVHRLMEAMGVPYYVALLSAAAQHGASPQQPQEFQVMTDRSIRPLKVGRTRIRFFASKYIDLAATVDVKTPTGTMRVSTPEATAVDLVRFARASGYLDHVAEVIAELAPSLDPKKLLASVRAIGDVPNAQRLGYILQRLRFVQLVAPIRQWLGRQSPQFVRLRPEHAIGDLVAESHWRLMIDRPIGREEIVA